MHQVTYKDIATRRKRTMGGVLKFLGVHDAPLTSTTHKVRQQDISEVVTNYDEVAYHLFQKGYQHLFS